MEHCHIRFFKTLKTWTDRIPKTQTHTTTHTGRTRSFYLTILSVISAEGMLRNCSQKQISPILAQRTRAGMTDNITFSHKSMVSHLETVRASVTITRCRSEGVLKWTSLNVSCDDQVWCPGRPGLGVWVLMSSGGVLYSEVQCITGNGHKVTP